MSAAASIALLILIIEVAIFAFAILITLVIAGLAVVESTGLTRRFLRQQAKRADRASKAVEDRVQRHLLPPLIRFERGHAWTRQFIRSLRGRGPTPPPS